MTPGLKIGIACFPTVGGSGAVATELGLALAEVGHDIHFFAYEVPFRLDRYRKNVTYHQVAVHEYPLFKYPSYNLALATTMADVAEREGLDLLHVHYAIPHAVSAFLASEMVGSPGIKTVVTLHGTDITIVGTDRSYHRVTRFCLERAGGITAVSSFLRTATQEKFGTDRHIEVIHNFVDARRFQCAPCSDARTLRAGDAPVICHVSNFRAVKRVGDLVQAFIRVAPRSAARLLMVGDGPERVAAEQAIEAAGLRDRAQFLGLQGDVESILPCADIFVLPSEFESFGLAALEAMACGLPVIATRAGGIPEVIRDGENGLLVEVGDVDELTAKIDLLLTRPDEGRRLGMQARLDATNEFSLDRIRKSYEAFYERVMLS